MSIILQGPFSQCFHFYYLAEIWKLFQIQSCLEVYDNFKGHLAGQLLSPDKQSLPKYNTFNKLLFLYYCPPVIILRQKTLSYSPLNYSTFFTLLVHCYITPTMEMYPGMNYVCLIQETHLQIYSWSQQWHMTLQLLYSKIHMSILMSNLISCDMMGHPAEKLCTCVSGYYGLGQWIIFFFEWPLKFWPPHNPSLNPVYFIIGGQAD